MAEQSQLNNIIYGQFYPSKSKGKQSANHRYPDTILAEARLEETLAKLDLENLIIDYDANKDNSWISDDTEIKLLKDSGALNRNKKKHVNSNYKNEPHRDKKLVNNKQYKVKHKEFPLNKNKQNKTGLKILNDTDANKINNEISKRSRSKSQGDNTKYNVKKRNHNRYQAADGIKSEPKQFPRSSNVSNIAQLDQKIPQSISEEDVESQNTTLEEIEQNKIQQQKDQLIDEEKSHRLLDSCLMSAENPDLDNEKLDNFEILNSQSLIPKEISTDNVLNSKLKADTLDTDEQNSRSVIDNTSNSFSNTQYITSTSPNASYQENPQVSMDNTSTPLKLKEESSVYQDAKSQIVQLIENSNNRKNSTTFGNSISSDTVVPPFDDHKVEKTFESDSNDSVSASDISNDLDIEKQFSFLNDQISNLKLQLRKQKVQQGESNKYIHQLESCINLMMQNYQYQEYKLHNYRAENRGLKFINRYQNYEMANIETINKKKISKSFGLSKFRVLAKMVVAMIRLKGTMRRNKKKAREVQRLITTQWLVPQINADL